MFFSIILFPFVKYFTNNLLLVTTLTPELCIAVAIVGIRHKRDLGYGKRKLLHSPVFKASLALHHAGNIFCTEDRRYCLRATTQVVKMCFVFAVESDICGCVIIGKYVPSSHKSGLFFLSLIFITSPSSTSRDSQQFLFSSRNWPVWCGSFFFLLSLLFTLMLHALPYWF